MYGDQLVGLRTKVANYTQNIPKIFAQHLKKSSAKIFEQKYWLH